MTDLTTIPGSAPRARNATQAPRSFAARVQGDPPTDRRSWGNLARLLADEAVQA